MAELLKYIYNQTFFQTYSRALSAVIPDFDQSSFLAAFNTPHWESLELKQRMAYLAHITSKLLPSSFAEKVTAIISLIGHLKTSGIRDQNLEYIFLADIITEHGLEDLETSISAIEKITQFVSFEFAGRAFIIHHPKEMMRQMLRWTSHKNENVRRFTSEGCRPRLPWGTKLVMFIKDPLPCIAILEKLIHDPSAYVRKSVANHLNDISKDHPELVVKFVKKWKGTSDNADWIVRHGSRTLLKNGNVEILSIFGTSKDIAFSIDDFKLEHKQLKQNELLPFTFSLTNLSQEQATFRIEYNIWYVKAGGQYSKKIFKIAEKNIPAQAKVTFLKSHKFQDLTTRRHYSGTHKVSIVINGNESEARTFDLETIF